MVRLQSVCCVSRLNMQHHVLAGMGTKEEVFFSSLITNGFGETFFLHLLRYLGVFLYFVIQLIVWMGQGRQGQLAT